MDVYLVCVLLNPVPKDKADNATPPTIVVDPKAVVARDEAAALVAALKLVPAEHSGKEHLLEPRAIPFGRSSR